MLDQPLVVRRDGSKAALPQRPLDQADEGGVDVGLVRIGHVARLEVRALDEAQVRSQVEQRREVVFRPVEVGLEHGARVLVSGFAESPVDAQRRVDEP